MRFSKTSLYGGAIGLLMGLAFTVISLFQFDDSETNAGDVILAGLVIGVPISVMIGLGIGWLWGRIFGPDSF